MHRQSWQGMHILPSADAAAFRLQAAVLRGKSRSQNIYRWLMKDQETYEDAFFI